MRATKIPLKNDNLPNNKNIVKYDNIYFKMHIRKLIAIKLRKRQLIDIKKKYMPMHLSDYGQVKNRIGKSINFYTCYSIIY